VSAFMGYDEIPIIGTGVVRVMIRQPGLRHAA